MKRLLFAVILGFCTQSPGQAHARMAKPLVVLLHGCGQTVSDFLELTQFAEFAKQNDFLLYTPSQSVWMNPYRCWNWFSPMNQERGLIGETVSIVQAIEKIKSQHNVDAKRIYAVGFSAGAGLSLNLLYCFPEVFAGAAIHSGPVYGVARDGVAARKVMADASGLTKKELQQRALSCSGLSAKTFSKKKLLVFQGDADDVVNVKNAHEIVQQFPGRAKLSLFDGLDHDWAPTATESIIEDFNLSK